MTDDPLLDCQHKVERLRKMLEEIVSQEQIPSNKIGRSYVYVKGPSIDKARELLAQL